MKKLLIASNILLLGFIIFQAQSQNSKTAEKNRPNGALYNLPDTCTHFFCKDYSNIPLEGIISGDLLKNMSTLYSRDMGKSKVNYNPCNAGTPWLRTQQDALSVCFDLEKVKNFVWHIEHSVCTAGCDSALQLGIRFYYIKYDTAKLGKSHPLLRSWIVNNHLLLKHSLAMVPTYYRAGEWHDFDYTQTIDQPCRFSPIDPTNIAKMLVVTSMGNGDNHGGIGPPPAPGTYPTN